METKNYRKTFKILIATIIMTISFLCALLLTSCNGSSKGSGCNSGGGVCKAQNNIQLNIN